jgi:transposase
MNSMPHDRLARRVTVGVDTHGDVHVAVALDELGARLGERTVPATAAGYDQLAGWAASLGAVAAVGVEGSGSYGAGLTRRLLGAGQRVVEVNRTDRATRRRRGKNDAIDAEAAARAVLAGAAGGAPKSGDGPVEMLRMLKLARNSAVKAATAALNQIRAVLVTAPTGLRASLSGLSIPALLTRCAGLRPGPLSTVLAAAKHTLRLLARRAQALRAEASGLTGHIRGLTETLAPQLCARFGIGPDTAAQFLITAGDNPTRLHSEAAFAAICAANPVPASSGKTTRHRLNRGGDRQANAALHRVVIVRLRHHAPTRAYLTRRLAEGKTKPEIIRCLKRAIAREIYHLLPT